ncbi:trypsin-like peptidase domain-containing protein [Streptomyces sp. NPDC048290]|uniref:VMAP-C domain-containing protein n=1 Tax=Streptomyces sp. NPDC048290 TaxID=3155811 RepID=UPI00342E8ABA
MRTDAWHARIDCGRDVGAGFLISARQVLTCAHVVRGSEAAEVTVRFPNRADLGAVPASVAVRGGWRGGAADPGDLAVLELAREVPLAPAEFAPPGAEARGAELVAYGFPRGYDEGMVASYRALPGPLIAGEWVQLEALTGHGQPLAGGFSGAAVTLADGTVVGMVTSVAGAADTRVGRMLPTEVMARHWYGLGELVPTDGHRPELRRRLYGLVRRARRAGLPHRPEQLYVEAVGEFGPPVPQGGFGSLERMAAYVQWEVADPQAVPRLAGLLERLLAPEPARPAPAPAPATASASASAPAPVWAPIVVEIEHSGAGPDQVTVEVFAYRDGHRRPVGAGRLPRGGVRAYVQERVDEAFTQLAPDADELLAFVLPRDLLNEPVARWARGADDPTPLGCAYPLVVADRSRHRSGGLRHQLTRKWRHLDADPGTAPHRIACDTPERPPGLRKRLRDDAVGMVAYSSAPGAAGPHFEVGLHAPVPVLLWPRSGCPGPGHPGDCAGGAFLDLLAASVRDVPPAALPRHLLALRETAAADDDPDGHWAHDVQLLWDDPRCFPEPRACDHSPVA